MIVVDTNVLIPLWIDMPQSVAAMDLQQVDPSWYAPYLWRSEFRNAIAMHIRHRDMPIERARRIVGGAEEMMDGREVFVDRDLVLALVASSTCTAYDCEFVALAIEMDVPLVTTDKQVLRDFPRVAAALGSYR